MLPLPPSGQDIFNFIYVIAGTIAHFVAAQPLVTAFILAAIAIAAELPPVFLLIGLIVLISFFLHR